VFCNGVHTAIPTPAIPTPAIPTPAIPTPVLALLCILAKYTHYNISFINRALIITDFQLVRHLKAAGTTG